MGGKGGGGGNEWSLFPNTGGQGGQRPQRPSGSESDRSSSATRGSGSNGTPQQLDPKLAARYAEAAKWGLPATLFFGPAVGAGAAWYGEGREARRQNAEQTTPEGFSGPRISPRREKITYTGSGNAGASLLEEAEEDDR